MLFTILENARISAVALPDEASGIQWLTTSEGEEHRRLALVEARHEAWTLAPRRGTELFDEAGHQHHRVDIDPLQTCAYTVRGGDIEASIIVSPTGIGDTTFSITGFTADGSLTIGRSPHNEFVYDSPYVSTDHARLEFADGLFTLTDLDSGNGTYVNGVRIAALTPCKINPSDAVEILGLKITVGANFISYNRPIGFEPRLGDGCVEYHEPPVVDHDQDDGIDGDDDSQYFYPAPRFKRDVEPFAISVDQPPAAQKPDKTSAAMQVGPSMFMVLASLVSGASSFSQAQQPGGSLMSVLPTAVMAISMLLGSVIWPILSKRVQNKQIAAEEVKRRQRYAEYLDGVRSRIAAASQQQKRILSENRISTQESIQRVVVGDSRMMDRTSAHDDFLELRLGMGTIPLNADIRYPEEHFAVEKDDLSQVVYQLAREPKEVRDVPVALRLTKNSVVGLHGMKDTATALMQGLVAQIAALHSYEDVKIVLVCDPDERERWVWAGALPHMFSDDRAERYLATSAQETSGLSLHLGKIAEERREESDKDSIAMPYYVVVCTSKSLMEKSDFIDDLARRPAPGFTLVCQAANRNDLPKQCTAIISVDGSEGMLLGADDTSNGGLRFVADAFASDEDCLRLSQALAEVRLDVAEAHSVLPDSLNFLDMYEAGNVEQLNVKARWNESHASETLAARVGVDSQGEPFNLNLHEKFHGPHGLIAGTTGSGKSEFIITWVLSMCVEYSPEEVAFVLIDYKGGGLAGAFDNNRIRLPHLAGTITNLDGAAIVRSMVSIQSELKRRQTLFNEAREVAGGENVDIYKYLRMYRDGLVSEPCPHLFIVADEFAELKQQEPEFLDELVSAARIGRSLGVHLVLATQKPSGVVNDQIWSNSRFKVSLKVADAADSQEMIQRPDAAELTQAGRFYMLVGYNEMFALGQAAYSGSPYVPTEQYRKQVDDSVDLISNLGQVIAAAKPETHDGLAAEGAAPQLVVVLQHIAEVAQSEHMRVRQLWLDPLPELLPLERVEQHRQEVRQRDAALLEDSAEVAEDIAFEEPDEYAAQDGYVLEPVVGILDDPAHQQQRLLTLPLTAGGNAVLYGSADSGMESVLLAMLLDLVRTHTASECNIYAIDFGSESLTALAAAPQVGDVIVNGEDEKVMRLFDMLDAMIQDRRRTLVPFGGSFERYTATHDDMPAVVFVINGIAAFTELYEQQLMDRLVKIARDGQRVGISLLLTASSSSDVRLRLASNVKQRMVFMLDNADEYMNLLGSMNGVSRPTAFAQGLVKSEDTTFMFQGAQVLGRDADEFGYAVQICADLRAEVRNVEGNVLGAAQAVPVLPEHVTQAVLQQLPKVGNSLNLRYGLHVDDLSPAEFDFDAHAIERCSYNKVQAGTAFIEEMIRVSSIDTRFKTYLFDVSEQLEELPGICEIESVDAHEFVEWLDAAANFTELPEKTMLIFVSGMSNALQRAEPGVAVELTKWLEGLRLKDNIRIVMFDAAAEARNVNSESWFTSQIGINNGLWIGSGFESQSVVTPLTYGQRKKNLGDDGGYSTVDGVPHEVKVVS